MDLDKINLDRSDKGYILNDDQITIIPEKKRMFFSSDVERCKVSGKSFYLKRVNPFEEELNGVNEMALGNAYNDLGVNSVVGYPVLQNKGHRYDTVKMLTQDVCKLKGLDVEIGSKVLSELDKKYPYKRTSSWEIVRNSRVKGDLLEIMTEECYNKLVNMHLLDNLTTNCDRHSNNYFFVKSKGSDKWEDIVTIDHEYLGVVEYECVGGNTYECIENYVKNKHSMIMPMDTHKELSHSHRIKSINQMIDKGKLSDQNIALLRNATEYDLLGAYDKILNKYQINSETLDYYRRLIDGLWEYNRKNLTLR